MDPLTDIEAEWTNYFTAVAGASGAIFGLLFLGVQFKSAHWRNDSLRVYGAVVALWEVAAPLLVSLIVLMPHSTWETAATVVGTTGATIAVGHLAALCWRIRRPGKHGSIRWPDSARICAGSIGSGALFGLLLISPQRFDPPIALATIAWTCLFLVVLGIIDAFVFLANWQALHK